MKPDLPTPGEASTNTELARLEHDVNTALTEIVERVRAQCIETRRHDAVGQLPYYLARRVHEQVAASLVLIRRGMNGAVTSNARAILDACFLLGALGSERSSDVAEAYVAYELCVDRLMQRMAVPDTTEATALRPRWEATIPGFGAASSATEAQASIATIECVLSNLGLEAWSKKFEAIYIRKPEQVPRFTDMIDVTMFDLAQLADLDDLYKSIYWHLSESVHARNVIRDSLRLSDDGSVQVAGATRPDLLAFALNTVIPIANVAVTTIARVHEVVPIAASLRAIWEQRVVAVERDLPER